MRLWLTVLCLIVLVAASTAFFRLSQARQPGAFPSSPAIPYFHYSPPGAPRGRVLVVHGLDASKEVMNLLSLALADSGLEVYSMDLPGHGDSPEGFDGFRAKNAVEKALDQLGPGTAVIGHSFGGGILLELVNERNIETMVLLSPAPTIIDRVQANRVLIIDGQFDIPRIRNFISSISKGNPDNIAIQTIPWSGHSGYIFRSSVVGTIVDWLGGDSSRTHNSARLALLVSMFISSIGLGFAIVRGKDIPRTEVAGASVVLPYVAGAAGAYILSGVVLTMAWSRLFATDYIVSFVLVAGLGVCARNPRAFFTGGAVVRATLAAAYIIFIPGLMIASNLAHLSLTDGRWWRFPAIAFASFPLFLADETYIRPLRPWWKATGLSIVTRLVLAAFMATGVLTLNRNDGFIILILHLVVVFWILLWLAGEVIRRWTQDATAAALFCALIQGWVFASIFITI